ncbi:MAG: hypothetical protein MI717_02925 [Spirochaetales bacterium]|nr:hypothetical protein [Spirochaetales bacterium]
MPNIHLLLQKKTPKSAGGRILRLSAFWGIGFVLTHIVTVLVTCVVEGVNWGINAWILDSMGFLAGLIFVGICWKAQDQVFSSFQRGFTAILIWSLSSVISRFFDILMLFGILKWETIYITPNGAVLISNIISEIVFGFCFNLMALVGTVLLIRKHRQEQS